MKKASVLISSIVLIIYVIAIIIPFASWAIQFVSVKVQEVSTHIGKDVVCSYAHLYVENVSYDNKKFTAVTGVLGEPLGNFEFDVILANNSVLKSKDRISISIAPNKLATIESEDINIKKDDISQFRIAANCSISSKWFNMTEIGD